MKKEEDKKAKDLKQEGIRIMQKDIARLQETEVQKKGGRMTGLKLEEKMGKKPPVQPSRPPMDVRTPTPTPPASVKVPIEKEKVAQEIEPSHLRVGVRVQEEWRIAEEITKRAEEAKRKKEEEEEIKRKIEEGRKKKEEEERERKAEEERKKKEEEINRLKEKERVLNEKKTQIQEELISISEKRRPVEEERSRLLSEVAEIKRKKLAPFRA